MAPMAIPRITPPMTGLRNPIVAAKAIQVIAMAITMDRTVSPSSY
jgi:hypothetical protein